MDWRLGIDLGTNSLGWWAFAVTGSSEKGWKIEKSIDGGVYIFSDGREPSKAGRVGESNAVARRMARGMRRNRDRGRVRLRALMKELLSLGLLPADQAERKHLFQTPGGTADPERNNPYRLRSEALERPLAPHELGRVLFHMGLRRGFKSNRIEESDEDGGKLKERIAQLHETLSGKTLGQYLWQRYQEETRNQGKAYNATGLRFRGQTPFYPDRDMYRLEFEAIRQHQAPHQPLSQETWDRLRDRYILFQWPLKPVERGACTFFPDEPRHWKDTPIGHDFRIFQELNALRWIDADLVEHDLNPQQRRAVLGLLMTRKSDVKFESLKKLKAENGALLFPDCQRFNLESEKRRALKPHAIGARFADDAQLRPLWDARSSSEGDGGRLDDIFQALFEEADSDALAERLRQEHLLDTATIVALSALRCGRTTASVSRKFMEAIVPVLRERALVYADAVGELVDDDGVYFHHSHHPDAQAYDRLPYYGEILSGSMLGADPAADAATNPEKHFGKINNPTVHVALNALRRVMNVLIERFDGPPRQIHVELARDLKKTKKARDEDLRRQAREERENERIRSDLKKHGIPNPSMLDIKKVKLWEELGNEELLRRCPFSGNPISFSQVINGEAEIEHILPFRRTLDDSMGNLTLAMRWANRLKGNRTPYEAFATDIHARDGITWETVRARGAALPEGKSWRFGPDAMKRFEADHDFIARQLTDNAYIARAAARYLGCLKGLEQIVPNRGGLTALLRGKWRLNGILSDDNRKNREDHRHHAIDAAVIALADRATLNAVSQLSARGADDRLHMAVPPLDPVIEQAVRERVPNIVVAYKPDHGWQAAMFKETAYGFVPEGKRDPDLPSHTLVVRKPLVTLTEKEQATIRDKELRHRLAQKLEAGTSQCIKREKILADFSQETGIRNVRILVTDQTVRPVPSAPYKGYKPDSYVCCDVWRCPKGRKGKWQTNQYKWKGVFWPYAETPNGVPAPPTRKPHPAARMVARLFKDDLVAYEEAGITRIMRVAGFSTTNNRIDLSAHNESNSPQRYYGINVLGAQGLRKLHVGPDGRVRGLRPGARS